MAPKGGFDPLGEKCHAAPLVLYKLVLWGPHGELRVA